MKKVFEILVNSFVFLAISVFSSSCNALTSQENDNKLSITTTPHFTLQPASVTPSTDPLPMHTLEPTFTPMMTEYPAKTTEATLFYSSFFGPDEVPSEPLLMFVFIDTDGQVVSQPTRFTWRTQDDNRMIVGKTSISPNGRHITNSYDTELGENVSIVDLESAQETALLSGGQFFGWHPNGSELLYNQNMGSDPGLWLVDAETGNYRVALETDASISGASISPDGQLLAYSVSGQDKQEIWIINTNDSDSRQVLESSGGPPPIVFSWSPNGQYLLYTGEPDPSLNKEDQSRSWPSLWLMDRDGQNRRPLNLPWDIDLGKIYDQQPMWSPSGDYIAVSGLLDASIPVLIKGENLNADRLKPYRNSGVFVENVETGETWLVAKNAIDPSWCFNESLLAFSRMNEHQVVDIWLVNIFDDVAYQVEETNRLDRFPAWGSP